MYILLYNQNLSSILFKNSFGDVMRMRLRLTTSNNTSLDIYLHV